KLRDLAGLIVIDFIDMEEKRNNRAVERRLKDALRFDRARIQLGRISHFGLMEMSRQRLRTGVLEGSTSQCPHCQGTGIIRSTESIALAVLRGLEDAITAGASGPLTATTTSPVALYILNSKRAYVTDMEHRHGYSVTVLGSDRVQGANFTIERGGAAAPVRRAERAAVNMDWGFDGEEEAPAFEGGEIETISQVDDGEEETFARENGRGESEDNGGRRGRRRRRRGRGGRDRGESRERFGSDETRDEQEHRFASDPRPHGDEDSENGPADEEDLDGQPASEEASFEQGENAANGDKPARRRRRGRRGGRRGRDRNREGNAVHAEGADGDESGSEDQAEADNGHADGDVEAAGHQDWSNGGNIAETLSADDVAAAIEVPEIKAPRQRIWDVPSKAQDNDTVVMLDGTASEAVAQEPAKTAEIPAVAAEEESAPAPAPRRRHEVGSSEPRIERVVVRSGEEASTADAEVQAVPQRKGWWQRKFGGE
nr:ribonuclease E/G [Hyphomicrobium sp.]